MYCTNCGCNIKDSSNFCMKCGMAIKANEELHEYKDFFKTEPREESGGLKVAMWIGVIVIVLLGAFLLLKDGIIKTYTCSDCGKTVVEAYYDPFDSESYFCEKCAREYFSPFPYSSYKVQ